MKKILLIILGFLIGFICTFNYIINNMQVDIIDETETDAIIRVVILHQWFNYSCEK